MAIFKSCLRISVVVILMLLANLLLEEFKLSWVELRVANHISENGNTFSGISSMNLKTDSSEFSIRMSSISSTHVVNFFNEIVLRSIVSSSRKHLLEKIGSTSGLKIFVSRSSSDVDGDMCCLPGNGLGAYSNSI